MSLDAGPEETPRRVVLRLEDFEYVHGVLERTVMIMGFDGAEHLKLMEDQDRAFEMLSAIARSLEAAAENECEEH